MDENKTAGLVLNTGKEVAYSLAGEVVDWFERHDKPFLMEESAAVQFEGVQGVSYQSLRNCVDYIILFGGDGTLLHTAHNFIGTDIPLLGINIGGLGFLTEIETDEMLQALRAIYEGQYEIEQRILLDCKIVRDGHSISGSRALNDFAINRKPAASTVTIKLSIDGEFVYSYRGDGIIIATPTGSTAYSLSAGGPIINPAVRAVLITPVCPHTLNVRPMVISADEEIKVELIGEDNEMMATADGHYAYRLLSADSIVARVAGEKISLIRLPGRNFYSILHKKIGTGMV